MNPPLRLEVSQPVLDFFEMEKIRHIERYTGGKFRSLELDITYPLAWGKEAVEARLASLCAQAEDAVRAGYSIIVVSDRLVDRERMAIPALLALSAIHQHLVAKGLRTSAGLVVETGSAREVHHFALLGGYGAEAVHPYLALESLLDLAAKGELGPDLDGRKAIKNFVKAIGKGLKKVMSKMGTSTYMSYTGAQIFEAVGLARSLVDKYFTGTTSSIEGIGVFEVAEEAIRIHKAAFEDADPVLQKAALCMRIASTRPPSKTLIRCCSRCWMRGASTLGACAAKSICGRPTRSRSCSIRRGRTPARRTSNTPRSSTTSRGAT